ncbi:protein MEMO1-like isoform X2 [Gordionus sp. m RMFG-2023]|uniref:protein MEMO1-like isoform X2 n=1 Tax=Gordionus sp. m RMFG-2023 TaxID=3053472 RepID=UPI0031FDBFEA
MSVRKASHAGTWYSGSKVQLNEQISLWLKNPIIKTEATKAIISPHAGYTYSGSTAAYAFKNLIPSKIKRIFILGPSHHVHLDICALSPATFYETPFYNLKIDQEIYEKLRKSGKFKIFNIKQDEDEHSLEMQLPYIAKIMEGFQNNFTIIPIIVGSLGYQKEIEYGKYLRHRFSYTYYDQSHGDIYQSIEHIDKMGMNIIESMDPQHFNKYLKEYGNTICGRHPIAVLLQILKNVRQDQQCSIKFLRYTQSNKSKTFHDSSVSYAAAIATTEL